MNHTALHFLMQQLLQRSSACHICILLNVIGLFIYLLAPAQITTDSAATLPTLSGKLQFAIPADTAVTGKIALTDSTAVTGGRYITGDKPTATDTARKKRHSPAKAAVFSGLLPGLGQAYNKKYWKIPVVYAGLGGLGYAVYHTASRFHTYRQAYRLQVDNDPATTGEVNGIEDPDILKVYRDTYKNYLDISAICLSLWYALQIVDAAVDAHLFEWNMRDDLSVSWRPAVYTPGALFPQAHLGISTRLCF
ncbi:MAG: DUF5683 domain-containing protein [Chitinophagales bacterium]|nr:DUF5683 domain-containing protein [Chitinophagales bacterium]MDW8419068.1 DUF5683 domain-containing protein [Chitinophagales bacterium]